LQELPVQTTVGYQYNLKKRQSDENTW